MKSCSFSSLSAPRRIQVLAYSAGGAKRESSFEMSIGLVTFPTLRRSDRAIKPAVKVKFLEE